MPYDFHNLNWADFEDLVRDLVGKELGVRFEAFAAGPDAGMDGRHSAAGKTIIQAKHYPGSSYSTLKSQMRKERAAIDRLAPNRYILATSRPLSPANKSELADIIGPWLRQESDILTPADLNGLLRAYPKIEKAHFKLWLSGAPMLERIVRAAEHTFNDMTKADIAEKVRIYAPNPSLKYANKKLTSQHVVIISGPPGVGKTTLADILAFTYMAEDWELVALRDLETGFAKIVDAKKQIFLFDDFLGKVALDREALAHKDSDLARFIKRVRASPNARFILTTRAYIFEEARRISEHLSDKRLDVTKYVLDVGVYTRRIKARILYNHLSVSGAPPSHIAALIKSDLLGEIVDHDHYNPRIIEWMTDAAHIKGVAAADYPARFIEILDHPTDLWDIPFRNHISNACRHLLLALYFCSEYGVSIDELRAVYAGLHPALSKKFGKGHDPKDFEEAIRILEGGFISISNMSISFVNPSLRDYLRQYVSDIDLLCDLAASATLVQWAKEVWEEGVGLKLSEADLGRLASFFRTIAAQFPLQPVRGPRRSYGVSVTSRIDLLIGWWFASPDPVFADSAMELAKNPVGHLEAYRDGDDVVVLIGKLRDRDYYGDMPGAAEMADILEGHFVDLVSEALASDDLERISDTLEDWSYALTARAVNAVDRAIQREFANVEEVISEIGSESTLNEHAETLQKLGKRASIPATVVERAVETVQERIALLEEETPESTSPTVSSRASKDEDSFDDDELRDLFAPLLRLRSKRVRGRTNES